MRVTIYHMPEDKEQSYFWSVFRERRENIEKQGKCHEQWGESHPIRVEIATAVMLCVPVVVFR